MESSRYIFHRDNATYYWTTIHILAFLLSISYVVALYDGGLFSAWFILFVLALVALMALSFPRDIEVDDRVLAINCQLERTEIKLENIVSVRKVSPREIRWVLPIFGGCGFWGYYGHFFDFKEFRRIDIYATEWRYMVEVVDIYDDYYYISCRQRDELIDELNIKCEVRRLG